MVRELQRAGWSKARALIGGWEGWQKAGLPVEVKRQDDIEATS